MARTEDPGPVPPPSGPYRGLRVLVGLAGVGAGLYIIGFAGTSRLARGGYGSAALWALTLFLIGYGALNLWAGLAGKGPRGRVPW